ncbi:MAG TPA: hypothetical protein VFO91_04240 [Anaerolineales bacterium]|nr:hypothetical protein [Anaerolineales bacterium]
MREGNGSDGLHYLKQGIYERQTELHNLAKILSQKAEILAKQGAASRVITIVLGAIVATQGVAEKIAGEGSPGILLTYTVIGVLIAAISGLEAAFRTESRSAELKLLAATCQSTIWRTDTQWQKSIGSGISPEPVVEAQKLLEMQDQVLTEIHTKAAQLGINITQEVRELWGGEIRAAA